MFGFSPSPLLLSSHSGIPLTWVLSPVHLHTTDVRGPLSMLWERPGSRKRPSAWMTLRQPMLLSYRGQRGRLNEGGLELEINPIYIIVQLRLRSHNYFLGFWVFFWKIVLIWDFTVYFISIQKLCATAAAARKHKIKNKIVPIKLKLWLRLLFAQCFWRISVSHPLIQIPSSFSISSRWYPRSRFAVSSGVLGHAVQIRQVPVRVWKLLWCRWVSLLLPCPGKSNLLELLFVNVWE